MLIRNICLSLLVAASGVASASTLSFTGSLDPANPNDVFLASFTLASSADIHIQTWGYGGTANAPGGTNAGGLVILPGGFDPYVSLFAGAGSNAVFLASNDDGGCGPASPDPACADSRLDIASLSAGAYTLALTLPNNFSIAENYGMGILGDGFIGLQGDYYDFYSNSVRTSNYAVDVSSSGSLSTGVIDPTPAVPEPASFSLLVTGLLTSAAFVRHRVLTK
jgi:hypothetical protein